MTYHEAIADIIHEAVYVQFRFAYSPRLSRGVPESGVIKPSVHILQDPVLPVLPTVRHTSAGFQP